MPVMYVAMALSVVSTISGFMAIGNGSHWHFKTSDIFAGRVNALLYVWVIFSTVLSIYHNMTLVAWFEAIARDPFMWNNRRLMAWVFHALLGICFISAHVFIKITLGDTAGHGERYLWGSRAHD